MKILFVDDDKGLLDQAKYVLERKNEDFEVIPVQSSDEALEYLEMDHVDIIISDYKMPSMDGLELLKMLREKNNETPFIIFTGKGREEIAMKALNLGANRYFRKGGDPMAQYEVLARAIEQEVRHKRTEGSYREMETELVKFRKKYEVLFENIRSPLAVLDDNGKVELANHMFQDVTRYSKEELEGKKDWFQFIDEDDLNRIKKIHDLKKIDEELGQKGYRFNLVDKYNNSRSFYAVLTKIPDSEETIVSLLDPIGFEEVVGEFKDIQQDFFVDDFEDLKDHVRSISEELFGEGNLTKSIKDWCLEELLIILVKIEGGATGKRLMSLLNETFVVDLSSSIVYPKLHDLEGKEILRVQEHIRTKEYKIKNEEYAKKLVREKIIQLFGVYTILRLLDGISIEENE
ncbi:MAG: response regulator [Candidatus Saliniplasma sp.]